MADAAEIIRVSGLSKTYGRRRVLDGVDLVVRRGEMVALVGPSGAGKSTLLRAIGGLVAGDADGGSVEAFGIAVQSRGKASDKVRQARLRLGFVFQQFNLVGRLSLYANAALGALGRIGFWRGLVGAWPRETREAAMAALQRVGVAEWAGQRASAVSGGQQQRAAIARALVQKAEAILADEPVASLDPVSARRAMELLEELNAEAGLTVVVSLHQVEYAKRYCRRAVALKDGKIVYDGPSEGLDRARLTDIYGAEFDEVLAGALAPDVNSAEGAPA
ncbi:MAG: phosphonate ABC transporter ATP-binding protein [Caulobacteraceae bacterium]